MAQSFMGREAGWGQRRQEGGARSRAGAWAARNSGRQVGSSELLPGCVYRLPNPRKDLQVAAKRFALEQPESRSHWTTQAATQTCAWLPRMLGRLEFQKTGFPCARTTAITIASRRMGASPSGRTTAHLVRLGNAWLIGSRRSGLSNEGTEPGIQPISGERVSRGLGCH